MRTKEMLLGLGIGAFAAFMADPRTGRRRRALVRDQLVRTSRKTRQALDATARDLANRTAGIVAVARGYRADERIDDRRLLERVRTSLGRACSHARAIDVDVLDGRVVLRGSVLASELDRVLSTVRAVRGVQSVAHALDAHETSDGIPALQGEGRLAEFPLDVLQRTWAPATQALVAAAGMAAAGLCIAAYARR